MKASNVELALKINKMVHNECTDAPHDIGLRIERLVRFNSKKKFAAFDLYRYFIRLLGVPFFIALSLIGAVRGWMEYNYNYIKWGGEAAHYKKNRNPKTIADVFDKVQKLT